MTLNKEPTAIIGGLGELIRQIVPFLVLFGFVAWDDKKVAGVFMLTSGILAFATNIFIRSQVTPTTTANAQIQEGINSPKNTSVADVIRNVEDKERNADI